MSERDVRIAYFDCPSGISGDMCLGAIVDSGVPVQEIAKGLKRLGIKGYELKSRKVSRSGIAAMKVDVVVGRPKTGSRKLEGRTWKDISRIIDKSSLPSHIKRKGAAVFRRLFAAEGKVHGKRYDKTHLHELGALDCLVDIFGTLIGLDLLSVDKVCSSPLNLGSGSVETGHGRLPVPAPATAEILKGIPVYSSDIPFELTTPTGAALIRELADNFATLPMMRINRICYGAGQKDIPGSPNVIRLFVGQAVSSADSTSTLKVTVIETNIDDMNPQAYEYLMELLFSAGALDVCLVPVIMKKGRPGVVLTVLCGGDRKADIVDMLFRETTTIGVRFYEASRAVLDREIKKVETPFGKVRTKIAKAGRGMFKSFPEYEDCKRIAKEHKIPLLEVMGLVTKMTSGIR